MAVYWDGSPIVPKDTQPMTNFQRIMLENTRQSLREAPVGGQYNSISSRQQDFVMAVVAATAEVLERSVGPASLWPMQAPVASLLVSPGEGARERRAVSIVAKSRKLKARFDFNDIEDSFFAGSATEAGLRSIRLVAEALVDEIVRELSADTANTPGPLVFAPYQLLLVGPASLNPNTFMARRALTMRYAKYVLAPGEVLDRGVGFGGDGGDVQIWGGGTDSGRDGGSVVIQAGPSGPDVLATRETLARYTYTEPKPEPPEEYVPWEPGQRRFKR